MTTSINIIVQRDEADVPAPDIVDPLINSQDCALSNGTQYIDANHKSKNSIATTGPYHNWMAPGSLLEIIDSETTSYKAMLTGMGLDIQKSDTGFTVDCQLQIEKVA